VNKPDFAPLEGSIERRTFPLGNVQVRTDSSGERRMVGHAAVFNLLSEDLGGYREVIRPGAFTKTLREANVYALFNHNADMPLASTSSGRLFLSQDKRGLLTDIRPTDTSYARDLLTNMDAGVVDKMSFGFQSVKDEWRGSGKDMVREQVECRLFDVSPVVFPAYPDTDIQARSALIGLDLDVLGSVLVKQRHGVLFTAADRDLLKRSIALLNGFLAPEPGRTTHSEASGNPQSQMAQMRKRLEEATRN
jgi:HK97 family phage prohead protease